MKLTVIGSWGAYPGKHGVTSGYLLQAEHYNVLLDCGSAVLSRLQEHIDINELDSVVLSHYHPDHVADVGVLQHAVIVQMALGRRVKQLTFYGHTEDTYFETFAMEKYTRFEEYTEGRSCNIGPFSFTFLKVPHPVSSFAMRIEYDGKSLGYTGDTQWSERLPSFFRGVDILLSEASLYTEEKGKISGHLTAEEAGHLAFKAHAGRLLLIHFPHVGDYRELREEASTVFNGPVELALEGASWEI